MAFNLAPADIEKLDLAIKEIYPTLGGGELSQFAKLFKKENLVSALTDILHKNLKDHSSHGLVHELDVKVCWIDKRPYAKMEGESRKGEIADGAVFFAHKLKYPTGSRIQESRCILLQAKGVKDADQLVTPTVSLNPAKPKPNSSTGRELRLFSEWPKFDLYLHAASSKPLEKGLIVETTKGETPPHGWFVGTPAIRPMPSALPTWDYPWLCGPAKQGEPCTESLGSLLARFFSGGGLESNDGSEISAGANFFYAPSALKDPSSLKGFDRLCVEILRAIDREKIPKCWTDGDVVQKKQSVELYSFAFHLVARSVCLNARDWVRRIFNERMPILLVMQTSIERPTVEQPRKRPGPPRLFLG